MSAGSKRGRKMWNSAVGADKQDVMSVCEVFFAFVLIEPLQFGAMYRENRSFVSRELRVITFPQSTVAATPLRC